MASRLLSRNVVYLPNLRAAVNHFRSFSGYNNDGNVEGYKIVGDTEQKANTYTIWPDKKLGPFGPRDKKFPLPGNIGTSLVQGKPNVQLAKSPELVDPEDLFNMLPVERYCNILKQTQNEVQLIEDLAQCDMYEKLTPTPDEMLECVVHNCPQIMRKDFADLFPWMNIMNDHFTIVTFSLKTQEDMTGWSLAVEAEREQLLQTFIHSATEICEALHNVGYWADFIDPSCGKPFLSQHTNASLYETDERYRKLGFEIDDLGCCKVIRHHIWGTHAYVGCLFTNAPTSDPVLQTMIKI